MGTTKRNDPCPCGSGKKYKHCCGRSAVKSPSEAYGRLRRLDGEASWHIARLAKRHYGSDALVAAWKDFHASTEIPFDESHPEYPFFLRWFEYDWATEDWPAPAEALLDSNDSRIDPDVLRLVEKTLDAPYSFLQVTEVEPGVAFEANDILRKKPHRVTERIATEILRSGDILYARMVVLDGFTFMVGNGGRAIPATFMPDVVEFREEVLEDEPPLDGSVPDDHLLDLEWDMRFLYFQLIDEASRRASDIRNTDGDPLLFHTLRYEVVSFDRAFQALRGLEPGSTDADLMDTGPPATDPEGRSAVVHWSKKSKGKRDLGRITQAIFRISGTTLIAEVNSAKRAARVMKEIAKRLGSDANYLGTEITSMEGAMKKAGEQAKSEEALKEAEEDRRLMESPEVQAILKEQMEKHWATWPDTPLPALRGMTPRQAAHDPIGRELLESLLLDFESRILHTRSPINRVDTAELRRELGI